MAKFTFIIALFWSTQFFAQSNNIVAYVGGVGAESFNDVVQLSNGTFLIAGNCSSLDWLAPNVPKTQLDAKGINNAQGTNQFGFLLQISKDGKNLLQFVHFAQNAVENIRFVKTSNVATAKTDQIFISGDTKDTKANKGGYFIAKLNNNFVNGIPTALLWAQNVWAEGYAKDGHPWDVGNDGKVVYITGQSHAADWGAMYRMDANGNDEIVENWRTHWKKAGGEYYGTASSFSEGVQNLAYSGMVFKNGTRCNFRSWTQTDFDAKLPDGNGSTKKGTWPLDAFFNSPCTPGVGPSIGPGYTGYKMGGSQVWGASSVTVHKTTGAIYLGMNNQSILPTGEPDFEPAVVAFDKTGKLQWWSRLYHEIAPNTTDKYLNSSPDQYIDGLAIDYATDNLVVNARCHGNNVENFWEGNTVAVVPTAKGFQNSFTGSSGNIHISWLGKLKLASGTLHNSTYVAEYAEGATGLGKALTDNNMDNWNNPNDGWATVNTTRLTRNALKITAKGNVMIMGVGRRVITTANAHQKMPLPASGQKSAWSEFVRVYQADLSQPLYSSLLTGDWDKTTGAGGDNTNLLGVCKTEDGIVVVGNVSSTGGNIPTANAPTWASAKPAAQDAIFAYLRATNLEDKNDAIANRDIVSSVENDISIFPNPLEDNTLYILSPNAIGLEKISIYTQIGQMCYHQRFAHEANRYEVLLPDLMPGLYFVRLETKSATYVKKVIVK